MVRSSRLTLLPVAVLSLAFCLLSTADAGLVTFSDITQSGQTPGDPSDPFGEPSVAGNTLTFSGPDTFSAASVGGSFNFNNFTDGFLSFTVSAADDLTWITDFSLFETGDSLLVDNGGLGTIMTNTQVNAVGGIVITELDHGATAVNAIAGQTIEIGFGFTFNLGDPNGLWEGLDSVDFAAILLDRGISFEYGVTEFDFFIDNQLLAFSETGTLSFIDKKRVVFEASTAMVPEPSTVLLFAASISMTCVRRKRSA